MGMEIHTTLMNMEAMIMIPIKHIYVPHTLILLRQQFLQRAALVLLGQTVGDSHSPQYARQRYERHNASGAVNYQPECATC